MLVFLKRHALSLFLLIVSTVIGVVIYVNTPFVDVWLVEYEYESENLENLQDFAQVDTVFEYNGILCRNETGSIADTLVEEGIRRHELKVQLERPPKVSIEDFSDDLLTTDYVTVVNPRHRGTRKGKRVILYWMLFGFFGGLVIELIRSVVKKPRTN